MRKVYPSGGSWQLGPGLVSVTVVYPDGSQHRFLRQQDGCSSVAFNPAVKRTLAHNPADDTYTLGIPGSFHLFRSDGKMIAQEDAFGNRIRFDWGLHGVGLRLTGSPPRSPPSQTRSAGVVRFDYTVFPPEHELNFIRTMTDWTGRTAWSTKRTPAPSWSPSSTRWATSPATTRADGTPGSP